MKRFSSSCDLALTLIGLFTLLSCPVAYSQVSQETPESKFSKFSRLLCPEKLYLQTDRDRYFAGDTIWIKGYLSNASFEAEYAPSNYIYVELIAHAIDGNVNGRSHSVESVLERVKLKRRSNQFSGYLAVPENIMEGIASLRAYSYWMLNKGDDYVFFKDIQIASPFNDFHFEEKEFGSDTGEVSEVTFFPESGGYLPDSVSTFGIHSLSSEGKGTQAEGDIYADGRIIGSFHTDKYGLGKVDFSVSGETKQLWAQMNDGSKYPIRLPNARSTVIHLNRKPDSFSVQVYGNGVKGRWLLLFDKTKILHRFKCWFDDNTLELPLSLFSPGINGLAVIDESSNVIAERSIFVYNRKPVTIEMSADPGQEKSSIYLTLKGEDGKTVDGTFSVSVTDASLSSADSSSCNMESFFYLQSEYDSFIEDSRRFFDVSRPISDRAADIDILMLTQKWKYYSLTEILGNSSPMPLFGKEYYQSLSGKLLTPILENPRKHKRRKYVATIAPAILFASLDEMDTVGRFVKNGLDFPENTGFIIATTNNSGAPYGMPVMDAEYFPSVTGRRHHMVKDTTFSSVLSLRRAHFIKASTVSATRRKTYKGLSPVSNFSFSPSQLRERKQLALFDDYDIPDYLVRAFPNVRLTQSEFGAQVNTRAGFSSSGMRLISTWQPVLIYIDQIESPYQELNSLKISDVEALALITGGDSFPFQKSDGDNTISRGVLMVKTASSRKGPSNVAVVSPLGWQKPRKRSLVENTGDADTYSSLDGTLYWQSDVKLSSDEATVINVNHRKGAAVTVIVEGITSSGVPVSYISTKRK